MSRRFKVTWKPDPASNIQYVGLYTEKSNTPIEGIADNFKLATKKTKITVVGVEDLGWVEGEEYTTF